MKPSQNLSSGPARHVPSPGKRLNPAGLAVTVDDVNIIQATSWAVLQTLEWARKLMGKGSPLTNKQKTIAERVLKEIHERLNFLC